MAGNMADSQPPDGVRRRIIDMTVTWRSPKALDITAVVELPDGRRQSGTFVVTPVEALKHLFNRRMSGYFPDGVGKTVEVIRDGVKQQVDGADRIQGKGSAPRGQGWRK